MTNPEILASAIKKAWPTASPIFVSDEHDDEFVSFTVDGKEHSYNSFYSFIFSKEFARAFWGEALVCFACGEPPICWCDTSDIFPRQGDTVTNAEWNLQQMVISEDPIEYLESFLR